LRFRILLAILLIITQVCYSQILPPKKDQNSTKLCRTPDYFWDIEKMTFIWGIENAPLINKGGYRTKGAAGVIPYTIYKNDVYILLSRESWGKDKGKYCDLGGAVDIYEELGNPVSATFLQTLLHEVFEESGGLYKFTEEYVLNNAFVISHKHNEKDAFRGYETELAFVYVDEIFFNEHFFKASQSWAEKQIQQNQCPWRYQEKDDYQWIKLSAIIEFLSVSDRKNQGRFENISGKEVTIYFRDHFLEVISTTSSIEILLLIAYKHPMPSI
jgi:hypothetical protein